VSGDYGVLGAVLPDLDAVAFPLAFLELALEEAAVVVAHGLYQCGQFALVLLLVALVCGSRGYRC
jgi:hypothetical protein